jgi:outer membrane protein assembly factor BamB
VKAATGLAAAALLVATASACGGTTPAATSAGAASSRPGSAHPAGAAAGSSPTGSSSTGSSTTGSSTGSSTTLAPPAPPAAWPEYGGGPTRSGLDANAPATGGALTRSWVSPVLDGAVYTQPLVVGSTVVVATENDTVYALDASSGAVRWSRHLGTPVPGSDLPCGDINPSGITGTPAVDTTTGTVWAVTFSTPAHHTLWGLSLRTGAVVSSRPVDPPGADPSAQQQRSALSIYRGRVYVSYGGLFGDCSSYHGWVVGEPESGTGSMVSFETPTQREGGIWAPPGPVVAGDGSLLVTTGNGSPATSVDDANSVLKLSPTLTLQSRFTPSDFAALSDGDLDEGSTSPALLPGGLVFQIGKDGVGYLLDGAHLGGVGGQIASVKACSGGFGGDAVDGDTVVFSCFDSLTAVRVVPASGSGRPSLAVAWSATGIQPGPPVIAGGVVWTVNRSGGLDGYSLTDGTPRAHQAVTEVGSFPALAAVGSHLVVSSADRVIAFSGV